MTNENVEAVNDVPLTKEEQLLLVKEVVELANGSQSFFGTENERKKDDSRIFSAVEAFNEKQKKEMGGGRIESKLNPLPLYINAISNLFHENPFLSDAETETTEEVTDENGNVIGDSKTFVNKQLRDTLENSDADNSVFEPALRDTSEMGASFMYLTTDNSRISVNLAYDPTSVIYDPNVKTIDGRDAEYFGLVESISYEKANEMTNGALPSKDRLPTTKTYSFGGFVSTPDSLNLLHFFRKEGEDVRYYQIVGDIVVKRTTFKGLSCLPVVPVFGQLFRDNMKKLYKGAVRDVKDLCKIVNGCYSVIWERVKDAQDPFWLLDQGGVEGTVSDFESETVKYKRWNKFTKASEHAEAIEHSVPQRIVPEIISADVLPLVNDGLTKISKFIGIPDDGIGFANGAVQQTALEFLGKSSAMVNNVSHFYKNLKQSIKHLCEIIVEMVCIYNGIQNTFKINVTKGPEDVLRRERRRQELLAILQLAPEAVKPLILSEVVKTFDIENADSISAAILVALPAEIKQALTGTQDASVIAQQLASAQQTITALQQQNEEMQKQIQGEVITNQAQLVMARENNEAALRSKLVEIEARAAENEKDRVLEMVKLDVSQQKAYMDAAQKSREADIKARETAVKELETAQNMRLEAEAKKAEFISRIALSPVVPVVAPQEYVE